MKDNFKCYGLHIRQRDFHKAINAECAEIIKRYDGAVIAESKDPLIYCASIVFKNQSDRSGAMKDFKAIGINPVMELLPAFIEKQYVQKSWLEEDQE